MSGKQWGYHKKNPIFRKSIYSSVTFSFNFPLMLSEEMPVSFKSLHVWLDGLSNLSLSSNLLCSNGKNSNNGIHRISKSFLIFAKETGTNMSPGGGKNGVWCKRRKEDVGNQNINNQCVGPVFKLMNAMAEIVVPCTDLIQI